MAQPEMKSDGSNAKAIHATPLMILPIFRKL
jgi:hypothetical protein